MGFEAPQNGIHRDTFSKALFIALGNSIKKIESAVSQPHNLWVDDATLPLPADSGAVEKPGWVVQEQPVLPSASAKQSKTTRLSSRSVLANLPARKSVL